MLEQTRALAEDGEDGYEFSSSSPNAGLGIRYNVRTQVEGSSVSSWGRIYCRLNHIDVTTSKLSIHQIVPCDADWIAEAKRVRSYVEGFFSSGDVSKEPSETKK